VDDSVGGSQKFFDLSPQFFSLTFPLQFVNDRLVMAVVVYRLLFVAFRLSLRAKVSSIKDVAGKVALTV